MDYIINSIIRGTEVDRRNWSQLHHVQDPRDRPWQMQRLHRRERLQWTLLRKVRIEHSGSCRSAASCPALCAATNVEGANDGSDGALARAMRQIESDDPTR